MSIKESDFSGKNPCYLGDGVYASFDGFQIWLETSDGLEITNKVALDPTVLDCLMEYLKKIGWK